MSKEKIYKLGFILMAICLISGAALEFGYRLTKSTIEKKTEEKQIQALRVVLPQAAYFSELKRGEAMDYYEGLDRDDHLVGFAFSGEAKGYSSLIRVMVGIDPDGAITGIKIVEQKETPGLGTRAVEVSSTRTFWQALLGRGGVKEAARPPFEDQFAGKMVKDLKVVTGQTDTEIQALTGATITSRAVTDAVRASIEAFLNQRKIAEREKQG